MLFRSSRGMVNPEVKRAAEAKFKAEQIARANPNMVVPPTLTAGQDGALSDRDIAANMLAQAKAMEINALNMSKEAARMKKDAERMDPTVSAAVATPAEMVIEAPKKRTRGPNKPKPLVADAAQ